MVALLVRARIVGLFLIFLSLAFNLLAQSSSLSNERQQTVLPTPYPQRIDSLTILPYTLQIVDLQTGNPVDTAAYTIKQNMLVWTSPPKDSVQLNYRVLAFDLSRKFRHLDTAKLTAGAKDGVIGFNYNPYAQEEKMIDFKALNYNGNFSRGISFGNNQDLVLNSRFNLQLAGDLGDGFEILAAITDENIPLQPQGNTQQLREFDRIFIQLSKDDNKLIAGDYELLRPNSYFMNYYKKLQGATFSTVLEPFEAGALSVEGSVAIARGKFARNLIAQQEGNQGPYKLRGNEGERFIIVLAGTEKVWIDGELLTRGIERDYIIDYNRGELTFTNRRLITKDSRIVVEFEYSVQNYLRTLYATNATYQLDDFRLYFNLYNEQDSKTSTGNLNLSNEQRAILSAAGDNLFSSVVPSIDSLTEANEFRTTYELVDTTLSCGGIDTSFQFLRFSTNPELAVYTARFSFVGANQGDYILDNEQTANERVYRFVAPDPITCQPQGDYAPLVQLVPPQQRQLLTFGGEYTFGKNSSAQVEVAISQNDLNRFSTLDSENDQGIAAYAKFNRRFKLGKDSSRWALSTDLAYELVQEHFQPLNPYRSPDFLRDWNLANVQGIGTVDPAQEQLIRADLQLLRQGWGQLGYSLSSFTRDSIYSGFRHQFNGLLRRDGWELLADASLLNTTETDRSTQFFRPKLRLSKTFKQLDNWQVGLYGEREKSDRFALNSDTLQASSFFYDLFQAFIKSPADKGYQLGVQYDQRNDYAPVSETYEASFLARELNINGEWKAKRSVRLGGNFTYRALEVIDSTLANQRPASTFLGRFDINFNFWKGAVLSNTTYEIGSGQEPKQEFTYVEVQQGTGTHVWLDSLYNNDGKIQPNEMEIAPFQDLANYIRITTITDEFIRTDNVNLNQSLRLNPKAIWFNATGWKKVLSKFSTVSTLKINRKTQQAPGVDAWNPFQLGIADSALVSVNSNIRNILFFNRNNPTYDLQLGQTDNWSKIVQTTGFESRRLQEYYFRTRINFGQQFSGRANYTFGTRNSDSEFFNNKDFNIEFYRVEPELIYQPNRNFRTSLTYFFQNDQNTLGELQESANQHNLQLEAVFNPSIKTSLRLDFSVIDIAFDGVPNSPVGFAILNGLQNGQNYLWNLSLDRQIGKNIQLRLSYQGRKTGTAPIVHVGNAQVSANF
ncbi:MAG: hypothetical protein AAF798_06965 [Bacteroidota bacterium]